MFAIEFQSKLATIAKAQSQRFSDLKVRVWHAIAPFGLAASMLNAIAQGIAQTMAALHKGTIIGV